MEIKQCTRCKIDKPYSSFQKRAASSDGMTASCKKCLSSYDKTRADAPHRVEARKEYAKTDRGIEAGNRAKKSWCDRNPIKKGASQIVGNAVRDGKLIKPNCCESCGENKNRINGHHDDYAYPLVVRWLCPGCHRAWHKENGSGANAE